jgi:heat shock protein HslJ
MSESLEHLLRTTFGEDAARVHGAGDLAAAVRTRLRKQRQRWWQVAGWGLAAVVILAGVGVVGVVGRAGLPRGEVAAPAETGPEPELVGTDWVLVEFTVAGHTTAVPAEIDSDLQFDGKGHWSAKACNMGGGEAVLDGQQLRLRGGAGTDMGCSDREAEVQEAVFGVLTNQRETVDPETWARAQTGATVQWTIEQHRLVLRAAGGDSLVYQVRDPIYPTRDATTIVAGERAGFRYRVALSKFDDGRTRVVLETRGPGEHWDVSGMAPRVAAPMDSYLLSPLGDEDMVAGVVPSSAVRVLYRDPALTGGVKLKLYSVEGARWKVFAGFVAHTGTKITASDTITAYDTHGQIVATCPSSPDAPAPRCTP